MTSQGFSAKDPAQLGGSILGTLLELSNASLVLLGFFVPKQYQHYGTTSLPTLNFSNEWMTPSTDATRDAFTAQYTWWGGMNSVLQCLCCRREDDQAGYHSSSALAEQLLPSQQGYYNLNHGDRQRDGNIFERFWRSRQPVVATTPGASVGTFSSATEGPQGVTPIQSGWGERRGSHDWSTTTKRGRTSSTSTVYSAPVYTATIPRWVLVDEQGREVDISTLEDTGQGLDRGTSEGSTTSQNAGAAEGPSLLGVEEGEEVLLSPATGKKRLSPFLTQGLVDKKVAFEVVVRNEGGGMESEWDRVDASRLPAKWSVIRTYDDFQDLYDSLIRRFGFDHSAALKKAALHVHDSNRAVHVADISADMRSLAAFLRTVMTLRLQCPELTEFLQGGRMGGDDSGGERESKMSEEGKWRDDEEGEDITPSGEGRASESSVASSSGSVVTRQSMESKARDQDQEVYLKQLTYRMRRILPATDHPIRLRTFKDVVSGGEICRWLVDSRACSSRAEAVELGTSLVSRGLLVPVVRGYATEEGKEPYFVDSRLWLFRYGDKLGRQPFREDDPAMMGIFSQAVHVVIPKWAQVVVADPTNGGGSETHIVYGKCGYHSGSPSFFIFHPCHLVSCGDLPWLYFVICRAEILISTQGEAWTVLRRYRDFSQLDKRIRWVGIKMPKPLPPKSWVNSAGDERFLEEVSIK